ncbi:hypothetical protein CFIMG_008402RA00001 [Ceratocystis fimbriata CBS 114723]|uniref:Uncharacterized protein n=1 Tax=Ceratocystis fimbriata CBS 114723 TaxID=1035309 RepID=A0A2C5X3L6_9PEZI|nr:hypothetical protein CFIMG_008402RA00001 [Ceratocystis fimbriata CBS 114723]
MSSPSAFKDGKAPLPSPLSQLGGARDSSLHSSSPSSPRLNVSKGNRKNSRNRPNILDVKSISKAHPRSLAQLPQHDLVWEWQYLNSQLISQQGWAEKVVRRLASLQAQRDSGEAVNKRAVQRKISLLQNQVHTCSEQQNSLTPRINQLALEIRRRQLVLEEYNQRMYSNAGYYQYPFPEWYPLSLVPAHYEVPSMAAHVNAIAEGVINLSMAAPQDEVSRANTPTVSTASWSAGCQMPEETPSLESNTFSDSTIKQHAPSLDPRTPPTIECLYISSCPSSPQLMHKDKDGGSHFSPLGLRGAFSEKARRQSLCVLPSAKSFFD